MRPTTTSSATRVDNPPLHALRRRRRRRQRRLPLRRQRGSRTRPPGASNYWVDVVFERKVAPRHDAARRCARHAAERRRRTPTRRRPVTRRPSARRSTRRPSTADSFSLRDGAGAVVPADGRVRRGGPDGDARPAASSLEHAHYLHGHRDGRRRRRGRPRPATGSRRTARGRSDQRRRRPCPCSIFDPARRAGTAGRQRRPRRSRSGVKFRADVDGYITGMRFYKGPANTGTHVGHLWTPRRPEARRGDVHLRDRLGLAAGDVRPPVAVTRRDAPTSPRTTRRRGGYALDEPYFGVTASTNPPLHALANGIDGGNGVYRYGDSALPDPDLRREQLLGRRRLRARRGPGHHSPAGDLRGPRWTACEEVRRWTRPSARRSTSRSTRPR